jgi:ribosomal protein L37E
MAEAILIACPQCNKKLRTPPHLQGKKIRCKSCGHAFTAKAIVDSGKGAKGKNTDGVQTAPNMDFVADHNPYAVVVDSLAVRCPHCAAEMESDDAKICLHCGYDTTQRERHKVIQTYETTGLDYFLWLLPGIASAITVLAMIGFIVFLILSLKQVVEDNKEAWWVFSLKAMQLWGTIFSLFVIFFCGRFAIRRLIFHPVPPERIKAK